MATVSVKIDGKSLSVQEGATILEAAEQNGIHIPTLCSLKKLEPRANCRMCIVSVEGMRGFQPACATKVRDGMSVETNTDEIRANRKMTLELILSHHAVDCHHCLRIGSSRCADLDPKFCEMCFFCDCVRDGFCELQALAREYEVDTLPYEQEVYCGDEDRSLGSVTRNPSKCIKCRRCVTVCREVQTTGVLTMKGRGHDARISTVMDKPLAESQCVRCGRCVTVCPTGAVYMQENIDKLVYYAHSYGKTTAAQIEPNILPDLETLFKMAPNTLKLGNVAAGLKKIGVDYVFSSEEMHRRGGQEIKLTGKGPVILTSSYAAQNFLKLHYDGLKDKVMTYPSAQEMFGSHVKGGFAKEKNLAPENIRTIHVSNNNECGARAHETGCVDFSINARELYRMFMRTGCNMNTLRSVPLDSFGPSAENGLEELLKDVDWDIGGKPEELTVTVGGKKLKAAIARNLGQARELLDELASGKSGYDIIRIQG